MRVRLHPVQLIVLLALGQADVCDVVAQAAPQTDSVPFARVMQFAIPEAPALHFIGGSAAAIERPTAVRTLASSLLSGIGADGRVQQGLAIETAPIQLLRANLDATSYARPLDYALANLGLSFGTVRSAGDSASTRLGVGVRMVLLDWSDPHGPKARESAEEAIFGALQACLPRGPAGPVPVEPADVPTIRRCVTTRDEAHRAAYRAAHWNDWAVSVGMATGTELPESRWSDARSLGGSGWLVVGMPGCLRGGHTSGPCARSQLLVQAQYDGRDLVGEDDYGSITAIGARGIYGSASVGLYAELLNLWRIDAPEGHRGTVREWSGGLEFRVAEDLWVSTGLGTRRGNSGDDEGRVVVLGGLRFNVAGGRQLSQPLPIR